MSDMLKSQVESILFVSNRPLAFSKLAEVCSVKKDEVIKVVENLAEEYELKKSGLRLIRHGDSVQMSTSRETSDLVKDFLKEETTGELTKPSLETLTIIAYRGPLTKAELEQIRGVNCSLILRNLMIRGLIESLGEVGHPLTKYQVTMDFLRSLGISSVEDLPDYSLLSVEENVTKVMEQVVTQNDKKAIEKEKIE